MESEMQPATPQQPPVSRYPKRWLAALLVLAGAIAGAASIAQQDSSQTVSVNPGANPADETPKTVSHAPSDLAARPDSENSTVDGPVSGQNPVDPALPPADSANASAPAPVADPDAALSKQMLGTWEDDYKGHRTLTLLEGGTGTMVVELGGFAATLFAAKLTFTEQWSVENGHVTMKATGGEPSGKVNLVLSLHGDSSTQEIIEVTEDRMVLIEKPSKTRFEWRRVLESTTSPR